LRYVFFIRPNALEFYDDYSKCIVNKEIDPATIEHILTMNENTTIPFWITLKDLTPNKEWIFGNLIPKPEFASNSFTVHGRMVAMNAPKPR
jgi:hypothetical protein